MKVTFKECALIFCDGNVIVVKHQYCNRMVFINQKNSFYNENNGLLEIGHNELNNIENVERDSK